MLTLIVRVDSIVRGTTSKEIVQMAKDVGAKKVFVASCAPPIRYVFLPSPPSSHTTPSSHSSHSSNPSYSNVYGIDMPSRSELVAHNRTTPEIAHAIGADLVIFQTLPDLVSSVQSLNPAIKQFDCSVFTGEYVTGGVDEGYLEGLERLRANNVKMKLGGKGGGDVQGEVEVGGAEGARTPKEVVGGVGVLEGKGGGGVTSLSSERGEVGKVHGVNGVHGLERDSEREREREREADIARSTSMNGRGDDTMGLHNSWKAS